MLIKEMQYEDYVSLQKEKTEDPVRRQKWLAKREENARKFIATFNQPAALEYLPRDKNAKILCVGARTGEEVLALRMMGYKNAVGIDLVPCDDLVVSGDMHDMPFGDGEFELLYTNVIDHSLMPHVFVEETFRVLSPTGAAFYQLQVGTEGDRYGVNDVENPYEFKELVDEMARKHQYSEPDVKISRPTALTPHNHGLNWNLFFRKV